VAPLGSRFGAVGFFVATSRDDVARWETFLRPVALALPNTTTTTTVQVRAYGEMLPIEETRFSPGDRCWHLDCGGHDKEGTNYYKVLPNSQFVPGPYSTQTCPRLDSNRTQT
jgi:hypothetical protein